VGTQSGTIFEAAAGPWLQANRWAQVGGRIEEVEHEPVETVVGWNLASQFDILVESVHAYFFFGFGAVPKSVKACSDAIREVKARVLSQSRLGIESIHLEYLEFKTAEMNFVLARERFSLLESWDSRIFSDLDLHFGGIDQLAASIVLGLNVSMDMAKVLNERGLMRLIDFRVLLNANVPRRLLENTLFLWIHLQAEIGLPRIRVLSVVMHEENVHSRLKEIVESECALDGGIMYENWIHLNNRGASQLRSILQTGRPLPYRSAVASNTFRFLFFVAKGELKRCYDGISRACTDFGQQNCAHLSESHQQDTLVAQTILNSNSITYLNYGQDCEDSVSTWSANSTGGFMSLQSEVSHVGKTTFMIDSARILAWHGIRKTGDTNILLFGPFGHEMSQALSLERMNIHGFRFHLDETNKSLVDLFFDPENFGFCSGVKFVALHQLKLFKANRKDLNKDEHDVAQIEHFLSFHNSGMRPELLDISEVRHEHRRSSVKMSQACNAYLNRTGKIGAQYLTKLRSLNTYERVWNFKIMPGSPAFFVQDIARWGLDRENLAIILRTFNPHLIVEVGSWKGRTTVFMAQWMQTREDRCCGIILCTDTWLGTGAPTQHF